MLSIYNKVSYSLLSVYTETGNTQTRMKSQHNKYVVKHEIPAAAGITLIGVLT